MKLFLLSERSENCKYFCYLTNSENTFVVSLNDDHESPDCGYSL